jgi:hypothetical protein|tara:strand:- start:787 stop:1002 length:216 start_codon:yes stop_codon:yes gene_type:complete
MKVATCVHHWLIDSPSGGKTSRGTCKHCHEERDFTNVIEYSEWYGFNKTRPTKWQRKDNKGRFSPGKGRLS